MPDFEDVKIASELNRTHHNTQFKRKVSLEKEHLFFRGKQIAYLIYEYLQVTGANDSACSRIRFKVGRNFIVYDKKHT